MMGVFTICFSDFWTAFSSFRCFRIPICTFRQLLDEVSILKCVRKSLTNNYSQDVTIWFTPILTRRLKPQGR